MKAIIEDHADFHFHEYLSPAFNDACFVTFVYAQYYNLKFRNAEGCIPALAQKQTFQVHAPMVPFQYFTERFT